MELWNNGMMDYVNIFSADNSRIHDYDNKVEQRIGKMDCAAVK
jgi:hypothetical protein